MRNLVISLSLSLSDEYLRNERYIAASPLKKKHATPLLSIVYILYF
jgi:hypothetical protein